MALFSLESITDRRNTSDVAFIVWATIVLVGLALVSIALGIAPVDPPIFAAG